MGVRGLCLKFTTVRYLSMTWFTDDEVHSMKADAYTETERGHSDVANLDYVAIIEERIMERMREALAHSRRWALNKDKGHQYSFNEYLYALYREDVIPTDMYNHYFIRVN